MEQVFFARVQKILPGRHGPYVFARSAEIRGSITFSLNPQVWQESSQPTEGEIVVLSDLRRKDAGWRAHCARFMRPGDQPANQEQPQQWKVAICHEQ